MSIKIETVPTLEHRNLVIFSLILKRWLCFGKLFELSTSICDRNLAIFWRDTDFRGRQREIQKLDSKPVPVTPPSYLAGHDR